MRKSERVTHDAHSAPGACYYRRSGAPQRCFAVTPPRAAPRVCLYAMPVLRALPSPPRRRLFMLMTVIFSARCATKITCYGTRYVMRCATRVPLVPQHKRHAKTGERCLRAIAP